jgi:site-specific DNA-methyltransferase (adenine-specific)
MTESATSLHLEAETYDPSPKRGGSSLSAMSCSGSLDLRLGDCIDVMKTFPDGHFDLAIVDPPYGIGRDGAERTTGKHGGRKAHERKGWDSKPPSAEYFEELRRVSKHQIIWGANYYPEHLKASMGWIFWDKGQRICNSDGELAYSSFERALRVIEMNRVELLKEGTIHPTQKPVKLYNWLLMNYAKPGQRVLDTHLGSGSHAIAAHYFGVHLTACEIDAGYFEAAKARIDRETSQTQLFSPLNASSDPR